MTSDKRILENHGTQLMELKPSSIWAAAENDLESRRHNIGIKSDGTIGWEGTYRQYAFHRDHVLKSETPNDIIRHALAQPGKGQASGKYTTRLIYSNLETLRAALR
jgi:hypothetical protein